jgi:hypothetical protein
MNYSVVTPTREEDGRGLKDGEAMTTPLRITQPSIDFKLVGMAYLLLGGWRFNLTNRQIIKIYIGSLIPPEGSDRRTPCNKLVWCPPTSIHCRAPVSSVCIFMDFFPWAIVSLVNPHFHCGIGHSIFLIIIYNHL